MSRIIIVAILSLAALVTESRAGSLLSAVPSTDYSAIHINFDVPVKAPPEPSSHLYFIDANNRLVQIFAQFRNSGNKILIEHLECEADRNHHAFNLRSGSTACGIAEATLSTPRTYLFVVKDAGSAGSSHSGSVAVPAGLNFTSLEVKGNYLMAGVDPSQIKPEMLAGIMNAHLSDVHISYKFAADDSIPDFNQTPVRVNTTNEGLLEIRLPASVPRTSEAYKISLTFPARFLPDPRAVQPGQEDLSTVAAVTGKEVSPDPAKTEFYSEFLYNSTVAADPVTRLRARTNVGMLSLNYQPVLAAKLLNINANHAGPVNWLAFRPLLKADVDTEPEATTQGPDQIKAGLDIEWGTDYRISHPGLSQTIFTTGYHQESDRDLKFQIAYWHLDASPRFFNFEQDRSQRIAEWRRRNPNAAKHLPIVTAYRVRPDFGLDLGAVIRDRMQPVRYIDSNVRRYLVNMDASVEILKHFTLIASDSLYFLPTLDRRRRRNYLIAELDVNTGYFFNQYLFGGIQQAIALKFERGEQSPTFNAVNVFSVGFKLYY